MNHRVHDQRFLDLVAIVGLILLAVGVWRYVEASSPPPSQTALIEPSQTVRW